MIRCVDAHRVIECEVDCCKFKANGTNYYRCCGGDDDQPNPSVTPSILTENPFFWTIFVLGLLFTIFSPLLKLRYSVYIIMNLCNEESFDITF